MEVAMSVETGNWKIALPCTKAEAEYAQSTEEDDGRLPVLLAREPNPSRPDDWILEAYLEIEPTAEHVAALRLLAPSTTASPTIEHIAPADWVTISQTGLEPVSAGRFFVRTSHSHQAAPAGAVTFEIDAGRAFGTGHHETTAGCLLMLDQLARTGKRFANIADIGTGTGVLAFAAHRLWPRAKVIASDIDPVSIEVAAANAASNDIAIGARAGAIEFAAAAGFDHWRLRRRAPFDLVLANILAGPLIDLAPVMARKLAPGASLILAGLLTVQAEAVVHAYRRQNVRLVNRADNGEWSILHLERGGRQAAMRRH
jgi:ribosomal protein L11 methyltransferase